MKKIKQWKRWQRVAGGGTGISAAEQSARKDHVRLAIIMIDTGERSVGGAVGRKKNKLKERCLGKWLSCREHRASETDPRVKPFQKAVLDGLSQKEEKQYFETMHRLPAT